MNNHNKNYQNQANIQRTKTGDTLMMSGMIMGDDVNNNNINRNKDVYY